MPMAAEVTVLLEGASDVAALRALAASAGVDTGRVRFVDLGGVTNVGRALTALREQSP